MSFINKNKNIKGSGTPSGMPGGSPYNGGTSGSPFGNPGSGSFGNSQGNTYGGNPYGGNPYGGNSYGNPFGNSATGAWGGGMNGMNRFQQHRETHFSKALLIASLIAAVIFFLLGEVIERALVKEVNSIFFMGVYFAIFGLILAICLLIASKLSGLEITSKGLAIIGICIVLLLALGCLFEFLYELNFNQLKISTDKYVFAIDNSGSMEQNDPEQKRVVAVKELLENRDKDVQFAVYTFSDNIECIREMAPVSDGIGDFTISPEGGTPIVGVLRQIAQDMEMGTLSYDGCQVVLLTDGYATDSGFFDVDLNSVLKEFNKKNVSVSTVGLGDVDENMLNNISEKTGGISVTTDNVDDLANAMASAVRITNNNRNLLSARARTNHNWLYAIMRIVFLTILGIIFLGIKIAVTDDSTNIKMTVITSLSGIILGALIMEFGLKLILTEFVARACLVLLFSLMITTIEKLVTVVRESGIGNLGRIGM